jgi:hypothetical protein
VAMSAEDWADLGMVFTAGGKYASKFAYNQDRMYQAGLLADMAEKCADVAQQRLTKEMAETAAAIQQAQAQEQAQERARQFWDDEQWRLGG